jgi:uridine kinase
VLDGRRLAVDLPVALTERISALAEAQPVVLVGVDGRGGAGKSCWAAVLAQALRPLAVSVVHMDDFFLPRAQRPQEEPKPIGGDFDWRRLRDEVLLPLRSGRPARYARYDWPRDALTETLVVAPEDIVIVEGVYATRRELTGLYDLRVWVDCSRAVRLARGLERDGEEARSLWEREWMPAEDRYVRKHRPEQRTDAVVDGNAG